MLKDTIQEFGKKFPKFDLNEFLIDFESGMSRENLSNKFEVGEMPMRSFVYSLGLDFVKSRRLTSIEDFKYKLGLEDGEDINSIREISKEYSKVLEKNRKLYQSLTLARDENNALRRESRGEIRDSVKLETFYQDFLRALDKLDLRTEGYIYAPRVPQVDQKGTCIIFSDEHGGDTANKETTPNNEYNYKIMEKRLLKVVEDTFNYPYQSNELNVFQLLDVTKGLIHGGIYTSEGGFTTSLLKVVEIYTKVYTRLVGRYEHINVWVTNSNHDRVTEKPTSHNKWDNIGIMLFKFLKMVLEAKGVDNVTFHFTKTDYQLVDINGGSILAFHGDTLRNFKPFNENEVSKAQDICMGMFGRPFKHTLNGHFHKACMAQNQYGGVSIANGTLVGDTEYGTTNGYRPIIPSQTIFYVNQEGNIEDTKFVNLKDV